jgi:hypothetical protein
MSILKLISRVGVALVLCCTAAFAAAPPATPAVSATTANTAGVIVFDTDGVPQVVVFISKTGSVTALSIGDCLQSAKCIALANAEHKAGKSYVFNVRSAATPGTSI